MEKTIKVHIDTTDAIKACDELCAAIERMNKALKNLAIFNETVSIGEYRGSYRLTATEQVSAERENEKLKAQMAKVKAVINEYQDRTLGTDYVPRSHLSVLFDRLLRTIS